MHAKELVSGFLMIGLLAFFTTLIVTYLYSLLAHGNGVMEWGTAITFAIILGIVIPLAERFRKSNGK